MSEKSENPFGACTEKEIKIINLFRKLPPDMTDAFYVLLCNCARQMGIIKDRAEEDIADFTGMTIGTTPFIGRKDSDEDKK